MATTQRKQPTGYVLYRGPSMLDGSPIVAVVLAHSSNRKTGDMVQTYILADGVDPVSAARSGADAAVCGDCKHRPINGGACYVTLIHGPASVYRTLQRGAYPTIDAAGLDALGAGRMVRLGTYGDPAAVPAYLWEALTHSAKGRTGYTHQWRNESLPMWQREALQTLVMASVDSTEEANIAKAMGMRYFKVRTASEPVGHREFVCPASEEAGKVRTCATCGACDGTAQRGDGRIAASPVIIVHGAKARRFIPIAHAAA